MIAKIKQIVPALLKWFSANARDLPWRRTHDPYAIWVSEIMLQQTQVKTVIPYWERWMRELPTIKSAANAKPEKLHKLWEGLGYYTRVRNLQSAAQQIVALHGGTFPQEFDDVLALKGIGRYTAGAICSIAFDQPTPIVDGNVIRVLTRVFGIREPAKDKETVARIWQLAGELVACASRQRVPFPSPRDAGAGRGTGRGEILMRSAAPLPNPPPARSSQGEGENNSGSSSVKAHLAFPLSLTGNCSALNQSLMELGALVCVPRSPACGECPLQKHCVANTRGHQEQIPNLGKREKATARRFAALLVNRKGRYLVQQRPAGVVNAHLWEFPNVELPDGKNVQEALGDVHLIAKLLPSPRSARAGKARPHPDPLPRGEGEPSCAPRCSITGGTSSAFEITDARPACTIRHSITRYRMTLEAFTATMSGRKIPPNSCWLTLAELNRLALPSAHKKILRFLEKSIA